jgi:hypothetical protein
MQEDEQKKLSLNVGVIFSLLLLAIHIISDASNNWNSSRDMIFWFIRIPLYFFVGMIAANKQCKQDLFTDTPLSRLGNASRSASLIISIVDWFYIIARSVIQDDSGLFSGLGILLSLFFMGFDLLLALVLGNFAGSIVRRKNDLNSIDS